MTGGMATIAGGVLASYVAFLGERSDLFSPIGREEFDAGRFAHEPSVGISPQGRALRRR